MLLKLIKRNNIIKKLKIINNIFLYPTYYSNNLKLNYTKIFIKILKDFPSLRILLIYLISILYF